MTHISIREEIFVSLRQLIAPFLKLLQYVLPGACKQGIKSKAGAIKCFNETKITAPPNECSNIPFLPLFASCKKMDKKCYSQRLVHTQIQYMVQTRLLIIEQGVEKVKFKRQIYISNFFSGKIYTPIHELHETCVVYYYPVGDTT